MKKLQDDGGQYTKNTGDEHDDDDWEEITFEETKPALENTNDQAATTVADNKVKMTGGPNLSIPLATKDQHQFNRAWAALPADLVALNLRHAGELDANKLIVRHTAKPTRVYSLQRTSKLEQSSRNIPAAPAWT